MLDDDPAASLALLSLGDASESHAGLQSSKSAQCSDAPAPSISAPPSFAAYHGGDLYITEARSHVLNQLSLSGDLRRVIGADVLKFPMGIAIDSLDQTIFVADGLTGYVHAISLESGEVLHSTGGLDYPHGVALTADTLFVCDWGRHCVAAFDLELNFKFSIGGEGSVGVASAHSCETDPSLCYPRGVAASQDELFVADTDNHRIQVYSHTGRHVRSIYGWGEAGLVSPYAIAIAHGRLFVAGMSGTLHVLTPQHGSLLHEMDLPGENVLCGICADARRLFVAGYEADQSRLYLIAARPPPGVPHGSDTGGLGFAHELDPHATLSRRIPARHESSTKAYGPGTAQQLDTAPRTALSSSGVAQPRFGRRASGCNEQSES